MAKVCGVIVGLLCLFSLIIGNCNSHETQDYYTYNTRISKSDAFGVHEVHFRPKRQTTKEEILKIPISHTDIVAALNETNVKQPPSGGGSETDEGDADSSVAAPAIDQKNTAKISPPQINKDRPLLGVNGTGQRKDYPELQIPPSPSHKVPLGAEMPATNDNNGQLQLLYPDGANSKPINLNTSEYLDPFVGGFDIPDNDTNTIAGKNNITKFREDYHQYYNSTIGVDKDIVKQYWDDLKSLTINSLLSKSHRRAITVQLTFDFPFYGHPVRNITVATGGFLYTGEYVHSWLAATQYIAPLMANFDTSISNDSFVKFNDNGTAFTVLWENVSLQDKQNVGTFTFSVSLYKTGDIRFVYYKLPIQIESILDDKHPVKIGLSDAYIIDKTIFFARRKTIYEYHRVNFEGQDIQNNTIISLSAEPTCLALTNCQQCVEALAPTFKCSWCPVLNKCSTGTDRKRQEWVQKGCDRSQISNASMCAPIGSKGNNYGQVQDIEIKDVTNTGEKWMHGTDQLPPSKELPNDAQIKSAEPLAHEENGGMGLVIGLFVPILLVFTLAVWVFYAYRNPHTKSGQLLIQYRPSQWSWRRGEARYTAATIHM